MCCLLKQSHTLDCDRQMNRQTDHGEVIPKGLPAYAGGKTLKTKKLLPE